MDNGFAVAKVACETIVEVLKEYKVMSEKHMHDVCIMDI